MAFERESMEMRLDEEINNSHALHLRIKELEQVLQSQQVRNSGNKVEAFNQMDSLKLEFRREKEELTRQLSDKEAEMEDLKHRLEQLEEKYKEGQSFVPKRLTDGKSRERLQGELLQIAAKLAEKELLLESQTQEFNVVKQELASLRDGKEIRDLKLELTTRQNEHKRMTEESDKKGNEHAKKIRDKDETIAFLMNELARLKQSQSIAPHLTRVLAR